MKQAINLWIDDGTKWGKAVERSKRMRAFTVVISAVTSVVGFLLGLVLCGGLSLADHIQQPRWNTLQDTIPQYQQPQRPGEILLDDGNIVRPPVLAPRHPC